MYMSFVAGVSGRGGGIGGIYPFPRNTYAALSLAFTCIFLVYIPSEYKWDIPIYTITKSMRAL